MIIHNIRRQGRAAMEAAPIPPRVEHLATQIVDAAFQVHQALGPGLLESAYEECFAVELWSRKLVCERQRPVSLSYKGHPIDVGFRVDLLVEDAIIVELKAVDSLLPLHRVQLYTYLKLARKRLGFLINFNVAMIKHGIRRVACR